MVSNRLSHGASLLGIFPCQPCGCLAQRQALESYTHPSPIHEFQHVANPSPRFPINSPGVFSKEMVHVADA